MKLLIFRLSLIFVSFILIVSFVRASEMLIFPQINKHISNKNTIEIIKIDKDGDIFGKIGTTFILNKNKQIESDTYPTIIFNPVLQNHYVKLENIKINRINVCEGNIYHSSYNIKQKCNRYDESIEFNLTKNINKIIGDENWSQIRFFVSNISLEELNNNITYSIYIEYEISDFLVKQGDYYTYFGYDNWENSGGYTEIILPKNALLENFPEKSYIYLYANKEWVIALPSQKERYYIRYELEPWYKGLNGYLLSFLGGIIISFIFSRKSENNIISKLRRSFYNTKVNKLE